MHFQSFLFLRIIAYAKGMMSEVLLFVHVGRAWLAVDAEM